MYTEVLFCAQEYVGFFLRFCKKELRKYISWDSCYLKSSNMLIK